MATLMEMNPHCNNNIINDSKSSSKEINESTKVKSISSNITVLNLPNLINSEISTLFKIKTTQLKMLRTRGYDISREAHILTWNVHTFAKIYVEFAKSQNITARSSLTQIYDGNNKLNLPRCCVYYADVSSKTTFGKDDFRNFIEFLDNYRIKNGILVTSKQLSADAKKHKKKLLAYSIQVFLDNEISIDPTEHYLVPKHKIVSEEEKKILEVTNKDFNIADLILISPSDPIIKFIGAKKGQIVKIDRVNFLNVMTQKYTAYRLVQGVDTQSIEIIAPEDTNMI